MVIEQCAKHFICIISFTLTSTGDKKATLREEGAGAGAPGNTL